MIYISSTQMGTGEHFIIKTNNLISVFHHTNLIYALTTVHGTGSVHEKVYFYHKH